MEEHTAARPEESSPAQQEQKPADEVHEADQNGASPQSPEQPEKPTAEVKLPEDENKQEDPEDEKLQAQETPRKSALKAPDSGKKENVKVVFRPEVSEAIPVLQASADEVPREIVIEEEFSERLYRDGVESMNRRMKAVEAKVEDLQKAELDGATFKPIISDAAQKIPKYKNFNEFLKASEANVKRAKNTFAKKKAKLQKEKMEETCVKFELTGKSQKIVDRMKSQRRYASPATKRGWHKSFDAFLISHGDFVAEAEEASFHRPRISPAARRLKDLTRDEDVFDKLYRDSEMRSAAKEIVVHAQEQQELSRLFHPATNCGYVTPHGEMSSWDMSSSTSAGGRRPAEAVVDSLMQKKDEYATRQQKLKEQIELENSKIYTFKPKTNKFSRHLLQKWASRSGDRAMAQPQLREGVEAHQEESGIPRPRAAHFDVDLFSARIDRGVASKAEKLHALKQELSARETSECTFRPAISHGTNEICRRKGEPIISRGPDPSPVHSRDRRRPQRDVVPASQRRNPQNYVVDLVELSPGVASSPPTTRTFFDDSETGMQYLSNLEQELRGVIAEWQNISGL